MQTPLSGNFKNGNVSLLGFHERQWDGACSAWTPTILTADEICFTAAAIPRFIAVSPIGT